MQRLLSNIANLGVDLRQTIVRQRRVRLLNVIALIGIGLSTFFIIIDLLLHVYYQAMINLGAIFIVAIPVLYLNYLGKNNLARVYFILTALAFFNVVSLVTIHQLRDTDTENILIGFSAMIIVLYDNPVKSIFFIVAALSLMILKTIKYELMGWPYDGDFILLLVNLSASFLCIYLFTGAFKTDLLMTLGKLEKQKIEMVDQRNALMANKHLLRSMIDNLPVFLAMVDASGRYLIVNAKYESAFGLPVGEIEGKHYKEVLPDEILKVHTPFIERCLQGKITEFSENNKLPSGEVFHAHGKYQPIKNDRGEVISFVVYVDDITQLKKAEEELKRMNATKNKLLSIVSHDLKSPIRSLQGLLSISHSITPEEFQQITKKIERQVKTVSFTMDNLLNWVKSQLEGFKLNIVEVNINNVLNHCIDLYWEELKAKNIKLKSNLDSVVIVKADPDHLKLVIRNILNNAIKFTPDGGTITISCKNVGSNAEISIEDTGFGIPADKLTDLLSSRLHTSEQGTGGEQGTGLGLALCLDILALNGGKLDIASVQGKGTKVHIYLPGR